MRKELRRFSALRSAYYLSIVLRQMIQDQWRDPSSFDRIFEESEDPWKSTSSASEKKRFAATMAVLRASGRERFPRTVELGCAEGIFTERLAEFSDHVTALDYSPVALARARQRLRKRDNVELKQFDMRTEFLTAQYDLVVAMGIITSFYRPWQVRRMCSGLIDAIESGRFLLFSDVRQSRVFEEAWWGPLMLRGGEQIRRHLAKDPRLTLLASDDTDTHVFALFHKL